LNPTSTGSCPKMQPQQRRRDYRRSYLPHQFSGGGSSCRPVAPPIPWLEEHTRFLRATPRLPRSIMPRNGVGPRNRQCSLCSPSPAAPHTRAVSLSDQVRVRTFFEARVRPSAVPFSSNPSWSGGQWRTTPVHNSGLDPPG
jgi:hypothetical protein